MRVITYFINSKFSLAIILLCMTYYGHSQEENLVDINLLIYNSDRKLIKEEARIDILSSKFGDIDTTFVKEDGLDSMLIRYDKNKFKYIDIRVPGYLTRTRKIKEDDDLMALAVEIDLHEIRYAMLKVDNIYFDKNSFEISDISKEELDKLAALLAEYESIHVEIGSHTDASGSVEYNMLLSKKRMETAIEYLIHKGIDTSRLSGKNYGELRPVTIENSDEDKMLNRRVEFKITESH